MSFVASCAESRKIKLTGIALDAPSSNSIVVGIEPSNDEIPPLAPSSYKFKRTRFVAASVHINVTDTSYMRSCLCARTISSLCVRPPPTLNGAMLNVCPPAPSSEKLKSVAGSSVSAAPATAAVPIVASVPIYTLVLFFN